MKHITEKQAKAYKLYITGLTSKQISAIINISYRTVQNWIYKGNWKAHKQKPGTITKAIELKNIGYSYKEIAKKFNVHYTTVYKWIKQKQ